MWQKSNNMWFNLLESRSSIFMSINVIFKPATANGYSHAASLAPCFLIKLWKDICSSKYSIRFD